MLLFVDLSSMSKPRERVLLASSTPPQAQVQAQAAVRALLYWMILLFLLLLSRTKGSQGLFLSSAARKITLPVLLRS